MKITLEMDDFNYLVDSMYYDSNEEELTTEMIAEAFFDKIVSEVAEKVWIRCATGGSINKIVEDHIALRVKENKTAIVNRAIENVTDTILKNKAVKEQMPRKSEIADISKEWENYFIELINKAIAKKFK